MSDGASRISIAAPSLCETLATERVTAVYRKRHTYLKRKTCAGCWWYCAASSLSL